MTRKGRQRVWITVLAAALCCGVVSAAQQAAPKFEVVSIRALPPDAGTFLVPQGWTAVQPGGRYITPSTTLVGLILFAYDIRHADTRLLGLPDWKAKRYAVSASAGDDFPRLSPEENRERVILMVREMLADRFRLRLHTEVRQETALRMTVEDGGRRLKEVAAPVPPEQEGRANLAMGNASGALIATKVTIATVARSFGTLLRMDVIDATGLTGYYDFNFRWKAPPDPNALPPSPGLGPEGQALFFTTMKDQFGLRFSRESGPAQYWIVDHVEPPAED